MLLSSQFQPLLNQGGNHCCDLCRQGFICYFFRASYMWNLKCEPTFNARGTSMAAGVDGESYWPWSQGCKFMRWESEGQRGCWCLFLLSKKLIHSDSFIGSQTIQCTDYFLNEYLFNQVILTHLLCPCIHLYIHSFNKNLFLSNYMSLRLPRQQDHLQLRCTEFVPSGTHMLVGETTNKCPTMECTGSLRKAVHDMKNEPRSQRTELHTELF